MHAKSGNYGHLLYLVNCRTQLSYRLVLAKAGLPQLRTEYFSAHCREALGPAATAAAVQHTVADFQSRQQRLCRLPWFNRHEEVLWLLPHDGIPTATRMHSTGSCRGRQVGLGLPQNGNSYSDPEQTRRRAQAAWKALMCSSQRKTPKPPILGCRIAGPCTPHGSGGW